MLLRDRECLAHAHVELEKAISTQGIEGQCLQRTIREPSSKLGRCVRSGCGVRGCGSSEAEKKSVVIDFFSILENGL